jgi:hypothetical protein
MMKKASVNKHGEPEKDLDERTIERLSRERDVYLSTLETQRSIYPKQAPAPRAVALKRNSCGKPLTGLSPVVSRKARAARGWFESASRIKAPKDLDQPQEWEYVLLSQKTFGRQANAGFDALLGACPMELEQLL